ncbi:MAG: DUF721 domain-containing protein [Bacteroidetes bacterium]|nr:DUF721 domain-containing protein [Bacteroidota bacterium]
MEKKERKIQDVITAMYEKYRLTQRINEVKLVNAWEQITGPLISKHTTKIRMQGKTLYVRFDSAPLKNEMFYRRFSLIEAINRELGEGVVEKIFIE